MQKITRAYNPNSKQLKPLNVSSIVVIQDNRDKTWSRTGVIVEKLPFRKYHLRMLGSNKIVIRNRRFLKLLPPKETVVDPSSSKVATEQTVINRRTPQ